MFPLNFFLAGLTFCCTIKWVRFISWILRFGMQFSPQYLEAFMVRFVDLVRYFERAVFRVCW